MYVYIKNLTANEKLTNFAFRDKRCKKNQKAKKINNLSHSSLSHVSNVSLLESPLEPTRSIGQSVDQHQAINTF